MKKLINFLFFLLVIAFISYYRYDIADFIIENVITQKENNFFSQNEYSKKESYDFVKITDNFEVTSQKDILNVIYTILDSGMEEYNFSCSKDYDLCQHDVELVSNDPQYLSILNNFVHPFNNYNRLFVSTNNAGKIKIKVEKLYNNEEIIYVKNQINNISDSLLTNSMNDIEKIKVIHDYIINNTIYDSARAEEIKNNNFSNNTYMSHKANGVLINKIALCSGYTDLMAIFLNDLKIKNYKVSTDD